MNPKIILFYRAGTLKRERSVADVRRSGLPSDSKWIASYNNNNKNFFSDGQSTFIPKKVCKSIDIVSRIPML